MIIISSETKKEMEKESSFGTEEQNNAKRLHSCQFNSFKIYNLILKQ